MAETQLGSRVRQLRLLLGWRQEDLALNVGCSKQMISDIETGRTAPGRELILKLDEVLKAHGELIALLRVLKVPNHATAQTTGQVKVTGHLFFPVVASIPTELFRSSSSNPLEPIPFTSPERPSQALHIFPFGVAVAYESYELSGPTLREVAVWRDYHIGRKGDAAAEKLKQYQIPAEVLSGDPYCLVCLVATELPWAESAAVNRAVQLLSCPSLLRHPGNLTIDAQIVHEAMLVQETTEIYGAKPFGLPGSHVGWASWAGVALNCEDHSVDLVKRLVELEIKLQAIWCYSNYIATTAKPTSDKFGSAFLRSMRRQIFQPAATEHTHYRLMHEAVIETSRIAAVIDSALDTLAG